MNNIYDIVKNKIKVSDFSNAEIILKELIKENTNNSVALKLLVYVYLSQSKYTESIPITERAITLEPDSSELYYFLAFANLQIGIVNKAKEFIEIAKNKFPTHAEIISLDDSIKLFESVHNKTHYGAIKYKFDLNSHEYDIGRITIAYDTPKLIFNEVSRLNPVGFNKVLDLGCGTGLLGEIFRNHTQFLCGVDLSIEMLEVALERKIYNELTELDILTYLSDCQPNTWDVIVASSVFIYFGDLVELFFQIERVLCDKGVVCFDLNIDRNSNYFSVLTSNGMQFSHGKMYVYESAKKAKLEIQNTIETNFEYIELGVKNRGAIYSFLK